MEERALFITSMLLLQNLLLQHTNELTDRLPKQQDEAAGKLSRAGKQFHRLVGATAISSEDERALLSVLQFLHSFSWSRFA